MKYINILMLLLLAQASFAQSSGDKPIELWYKQPAQKWVEALPVGNGRMGAMVFGKTNQEIIQINEESVWAGLKFNDANPNAGKVMNDIRALLFADKSEEAVSLARKNLVAVNAENSNEMARNFRSHQTLMNVNVDYGFETTTNYKRSLDLEKGLAVTSFTANGNEYTQTVLASIPHNILLVSIKSKNTGGLNTKVWLTRPDPKDSTMKLKDCGVTGGKDMLILSGQIIDKIEKENKGPAGAHMKFAGLVKAVVKKGTLEEVGKQLVVKNADELILYIQGATNYDAANMSIKGDAYAKCLQLLNTVPVNEYNLVYKRAVDEHAKLMNRVKFSLQDNSADMPTDERLEKVKKGATDHFLNTLYFQYGRYLLIGSSMKPGILPANLQGLWNYELDAPWNADFHTNINLQMNYWPAEVTNISETTSPLFHFMYAIREQGRITAKKMYNARGWVFHHCTDAFGKTGIQASIEWGTFPMGATWMCLHFWDHYTFTQDKDFLLKQAYPIMKEHALFLEDYLAKSPEGYLVSAPSSSPENQFKHPVTGKNTGMTYGPTMDNQIIREFLQALIASAKTLQKDPNDVAKWEKMVAQLAPTKLTKDGRIMEWIKDYEEVEPGHRHISHLFGLYPGTQISENTPDLFKGASKTLDYRLSHGGGHTGWSRAWIINFYARLKNPAKVEEHLQALFAKSTLPNLFDNHPPFQIDGNFGGTAGIAEALLQSHTGNINLLPALPPSWENGSITGLKARGGFEVSIYWKNGQLEKTIIKNIAGNKGSVQYQGKVVPVSIAKGESITLNSQLVKN
ncbi:alpha-L-fucosidase 2 [Chitinophaga skermanii]|uniref:Alpha-L-fucosidase 2 n=1 Tax=Chitinophaga skermanii TaxID=331697 RepID=A0A327Q8N4_9BACT|nr:glycoside hydrolase family 95 protein [Chitinophaga skermanii]RAJ00254.1 alpha-L-fucosidase 2 [Chitinophaga skermanii]